MNNQLRNQYKGERVKQTGNRRLNNRYQLLSWLCVASVILGVLIFCTPLHAQFTSGSKLAPSLTKSGLSPFFQSSKPSGLDLSFNWSAGLNRKEGSEREKPGKIAVSRRAWLVPTQRRGSIHGPLTAVIQTCGRPLVESCKCFIC